MPKHAREVASGKFSVPFFRLRRTKNTKIDRNGEEK